jgi:hypothetical protein
MAKIKHTLTGDLMKVPNALPADDCSPLIVVIGFPT